MHIFLTFILFLTSLMDCVTCLKHFTLDYQLQRGFSHFKQVYIILGFFLLIRFGFNFLVSHRGKAGELKYGKFWMLKEDSCDDVEEEENFDGKINSDSDENDVAALRQLVKIERQRANAACAELAKERTASATAAEEAMAMILRLQNDKSLIEMELSQFRRLAEEKQIHDQQVIRSLQCLVWQRQSEEESCSNCEMMDALDNVLYSSRENTEYVLLKEPKQIHSDEVCEELFCSDEIDTSSSSAA